MAEEAGMRWTDSEQSGMFSYISADRRVPKDHPLRAMRVMVDAALRELYPRLDALYAPGYRPPAPAAVESRELSSLANATT